VVVTRNYKTSHVEGTCERGEEISKASLTFRVFNDAAAADPCHNKPSIKRDFVITVIIIIPRKGCRNLKGTPPRRPVPYYDARDLRTRFKRSVVGYTYVVCSARVQKKNERIEKKQPFRVMICETERTLAA